MSAPGITVGVDGSPASDAALLYALDEATSRGMPVLAVTVWWVGPVFPEDHERVSRQRRSDAAEVQDDAIDRALAEFDEPTKVATSITRVLVHGEPGTALVEAARGSNHLIVGTEHKRLLRRVTERSVSACCVRNSSVPVTVVPWLPHTCEPGRRPDRGAGQTQGSPWPHGSSRTLDEINA